MAQPAAAASATTPTAARSWREWLPDRLRAWLRRYELRRKIRRLEDHYQPLIDSAEEASLQQQAIINALLDELEWPESELFWLDTQRLLRKAKWYSLDEPVDDDWKKSDDTQTGYSFLIPAARIRLTRAIRTARRESISWWVQVTVGPLTGLVGAIAALLALVLHRR